MKNIIALALFLCLPLLALSQDIIVKTTGEEIKAKVLEISLTDIRYSISDSTGAATVFNIPKTEVFMIKYANGAKEVIAQPEAEVTQEKEVMSSTQMMALGRLDALKYYDGNGAMWGSAASIFVLPFLGNLIIGANPPKVAHNKVSDLTYLSNPHYVQAYKKQAHKRKVGKVALGTGIGIEAYATIALIFANSAAY